MASAGAQLFASQRIASPTFFFLPSGTVQSCSLSPTATMTRNHPLCGADITVGVQSALQRHPTTPRDEVNEEDSSNYQDRVGVSSGRPEPAQGRREALDRTEQSATRIPAFPLGRSAEFHNGRTGTGKVHARRTTLSDRIHPLPPTSMTKRKMRTSLLVACLPIFASFTSAQLIFPNCTAGGWDWVSVPLPIS